MNQKDAPEEIWLQCHEADVGRIDWLATTFWHEQQYGPDVKYIRADIYEDLQAQIDSLKQKVHLYDDMEAEIVRLRAQVEVMANGTERLHQKILATSEELLNFVRDDANDFG